MIFIIKYSNFNAIIKNISKQNYIKYGKNYKSLRVDFTHEEISHRKINNYSM